MKKLLLSLSVGLLLASCSNKSSFYTVTLLNYDNSTYASFTVANNTYLEEPDEPSRPYETGLTTEFIGWFLDSNLTNRFTFETTPISNNFVLYAGWKESISEHYIYFDAPEVLINNKDSEDVRLKYAFGDEISTISLSTNANYNLPDKISVRANGWGLGGNYDYVLSSDKKTATITFHSTYVMPDTDIKITVYPEALEHRVNFSINNSKCPVQNIPSLTVSSGSLITVPDIDLPIWMLPTSYTQVSDNKYDIEVSKCYYFKDGDAYNFLVDWWTDEGPYVFETEKVYSDLNIKAQWYISKTPLLGCPESDFVGYSE